MKKVTLLLCLMIFSATRGFSDCGRISRDIPIPDLLSFLRDQSAKSPEQQDGECIYRAIQRLEYHDSGESVELLIGYLAFKRPPLEIEKHNIRLHPPGIDDHYPAISTLQTFGKTIVPRLLL